MRERFNIIDDMSNPRIKSRVIAQIGALQGIWRVELCRYRPRRTDRQARYYFPCFCSPFGEYLKEQGNDFADAKDAAHEILKARFLKVQIFDKETGQRFVFVRSTTSLNTVEFNEYLDKCAAMLASECSIIVPEPSIYREPVSPLKAIHAIV